jgi:YgiT-type zinc finger domain-containing protein
MRKKGPDNVSRYRPINRILIKRSTQWPIYHGQTGRWVSKEDGTHQRLIENVPCIRCSVCDGEIYQDTDNPNLAHMMIAHGFRMNGLRYDNQNNRLNSDYRPCIDGYWDHDFDQTPGMAESACVRCELTREQAAW